MTNTNLEAGGFLRPSRPSLPTASPLSMASELPRPRLQPLKPGSSKETALVQYAERTMLEISGRYERRYNGGATYNAVEGVSQYKGNGYETFGEAAKDLERLLEVIWVSGTPALQIPFLLNIALAASSYVLSFPYTPRDTFSLLRKLDIAFASMLQEENVETGERLPGFEGGRKMTMTEKVRMRGLVEGTRIHVVRVASSESIDGGSRVAEAIEDTEEEEDEGREEEQREEMGNGKEWGLGLWEMEVARVYERTIVSLSHTLDTTVDVGTW